MAIERYAQFKSDIPVEPENKVPSIHSAISKFVLSKKNPSKNKRPLSPATVSDYELHLAHLEIALQSNKINPKTVKIDKINDRGAELIFAYLKSMFASETTHKKYFNTYETFCNYIINEEGVSIKNPFKGWHFAKKEGENEVIYQKEFIDLLQAIKGGTELYHTESSGAKRKMYYPWLEDGIKLGLFTGARRQEIPLIRWIDIMPNRYTGKLPGGLILLQDIKNTAIQKLDKIKIKPVEINEDLADFLIEKGYSKNKGSEKYILDPQENYTRQFIKDYLSKSFAFYIKFASERNLTFGCLRKTWFTSAAKQLGNDNASFMGGHSAKEVTMNHYINKLETSGSKGRFKRVFEDTNLPPKSPSTKGKISNG